MVSNALSAGVFIFYKSFLWMETPRPVARVRMVLDRGEPGGKDTITTKDVWADFIACCTLIQHLGAMQPVTVPTQGIEPKVLSSDSSKYPIWLPDRWA